MESKSHPRTSLTRNTPYIITIDRWDTPITVGGTPDGQNTVMLKMELFQVRSCPTSLPQMLTDDLGGVGSTGEVITALSGTSYDVSHDYHNAVHFVSSLGNSAKRLSV